MTISGERTEQLDIFCRFTGFTSDFLSFLFSSFTEPFHSFWFKFLSFRFISAICFYISVSFQFDTFSIFVSASNNGFITFPLTDISVSIFVNG